MFTTFGRMNKHIYLFIYLLFITHFILCANLLCAYVFFAFDVSFNIFHIVLHYR